MGTDSFCAVDLAVIKISESNLPAVTLTARRNCTGWRWVVAVGNPYNYRSIRDGRRLLWSFAKGRRIGILEDKFPIESFIQQMRPSTQATRAARYGVNKTGDLVGINSAILSRTGSSPTGYAFAIPSDIVKKVFNDIVKYGALQKAAHRRQRG